MISLSPGRLPSGQRTWNNVVNMRYNEYIRTDHHLLAIHENSKMLTWRDTSRDSDLRERKSSKVQHSNKFINSTS